MITVQCGMCQQTLEAPNELAGKKATCPTCLAPIVVPMPGTQRAGANPTPTPAATNNTAATNGNQGTWAAPLPSSAFTAVPPSMPPNVPQYSATVPSQQLGAADDYRLGIAAVLSFVVPGLGQIFKRQVRKGLGINAIVWTLVFFVPGLIFGVASVVAASLAKESVHNAGAGQAVFLLAGLLSLACWIAAAIYWRWQVFDAAGVN
jgi:TM2 domain-containing membrane protein YozV